ncbi:MAG: biotin--[acetyl-CoA-carboxylase] ligase [Myxococcales bacterium]|nr:biotin--[acetyl-CoA-carboxylase] ligase [Polyangiaceae bacterium]MDW8247756.1 biotin--[acetyl-CoA-carboxylase] ligase [Myxococcales bacterium]
MSFDPQKATCLARAAGCSWPGTVHHITSTSSTQDLARQAASSGAPEGTTFVADSQTQGRGRQGRSWVAPPGSALLASVLLRPPLLAAQLPPLSLVTGLALYDTLAPWVAGAVLRIKWPNDLILQDRKLAGILVEASLRGSHLESIVIGFGINLRDAPLPPEIAHQATSLQRHAIVGAPLDRTVLLGQILASLQQRIDTYVRHGLAPMLGALRTADGAAGRKVLWQGQSTVACGIDEEGRLLLRAPGGMIAASAGEVTFVTEQTS